MPVYRPIIVRRTHDSVSDLEADESSQVIWKSIMTHVSHETACENAMIELREYRPDVVPSHSPSSGFFAAISKSAGHYSDNRKVVMKHPEEFPETLRGETDARRVAATMLSELSADSMEVAVSPNAEFQVFISVSGDRVDVGMPAVGLDRSRAQRNVLDELERLRIVTEQHDDGSWAASILGEGTWLLGPIWSTPGKMDNAWFAWKEAARVLAGITYGGRRVKDAADDDHSESLAVASD